MAAYARCCQRVESQREYRALSLWVIILVTRMYTRYISHGSVGIEGTSASACEQSWVGCHKWAGVSWLLAYRTGSDRIAKLVDVRRGHTRKPKLRSLRSPPSYLNGLRMEVAKAIIRDAGNWGHLYPIRSRTAPGALLYMHLRSCDTGSRSGNVETSNK